VIYVDAAKHFDDDDDDDDDATFRVVPSLYYQLFAVFIAHADYAFPVVFAPMTRKTTDLYTAVIISVMRKLRDLVPEFQGGAVA